MFFGSVCAYPLLLCLVQYLQPVRLHSLSSSVFPLRLFDRRRLLLRLFVGGGVGEHEVDGDGDLRIVFLAILQWPLLLHLPWSPSSLSNMAYALSMTELSEERLGCCCTSWLRLSIPWLTIFAFSPGAFALQRSCASLALVSALRISLIETVSWLWLYLYFALMVR